MAPPAHRHQLTDRFDRYLYRQFIARSLLGRSSVASAMTCLTERRLLAYPWLILAVLWGVLVVTPLVSAGIHQLFGPKFGIDFIILYAGGLLYRTDPTHLYTFATQLQLERHLLYPTPLAGSGPFIYPPFAAMAFGTLTHTPLLPTFICWSVLQLLAVVLAARLMIHSLAPEWLGAAGFGSLRLAVLIFSSYPFVEGFTAGQIHGVSLLLITIICVSCLRKRDIWAGIAAGSLLYKPQLVLGFLIVWIVCRRWKSLLAAAGVGIAWAGPVALTKGLAIYRSYFEATREVLLFPYTSGFPRGLMVTPYGLMATMLPRQSQVTLQVLASFLTAMLGVGLAWVAFRKASDSPCVIALAALFPLLATPYALTHELLILAPVLVLLAHARGKNLLPLSVFVYLGSLTLALLSLIIRIPLTTILPIAVAVHTFTLLRAGPHTAFEHV